MTDQLREQRVAEALASVEAGSVAGLEELYDLMSGSVYLLTRLVTRDPVCAEAATIEAFVEVWTNARRRPPGPVAGTGWILDQACRCARAPRSLPGLQLSQPGSSRATHSTWCVMGNIAKARSDDRTYPRVTKVATSRASAAGSQAT